MEQKCQWGKTQRDSRLSSRRATGQRTQCTLSVSQWGSSFCAHRRSSQTAQVPPQPLSKGRHAGHVCWGRSRAQRLDPRRHACVCGYPKNYGRGARKNVSRKGNINRRQRDKQRHTAPEPRLARYYPGYSSTCAGDGGRSISKRRQPCAPAWGAAARQPHSKLPEQPRAAGAP